VRPTDPIQQIHEYARDLVYLFATGNIGPTISIGGRFSWGDSPYIERDNDSQDRIAFRAKWVAKVDEIFSPPAPELLTVYEYLTVASKEQDINNRTITNYVLTPKAPQLLEKPVQAPGAFISYSPSAPPSTPTLSSILGQGCLICPSLIRWGTGRLMQAVR
jgi:hypothetical protein